MKILITGFNGKIGYEVAKMAKEQNLQMICAVRDIERAKEKYGDSYEFVCLDFSKPETFQGALLGVDQIFLMYPPRDNIQFERFIESAKEQDIKYIVYLSLKDIQFLPFVHHFKNERLIKKSKIPYTFLRAGYFMQNLNDFLNKEIKERNRIFVPAGHGKTSFVDARDIAELAVLSLTNPEKHHNQKYVITGDESLDFFEVAKIMSEILNKDIRYTNPSVKEFKEFMIAHHGNEKFINVVVGVHFPTKLGFAKGINYDFEKLTKRKPTKLRKYIEDFKENWI
ncbi:SDR family oxidoreductase [Neobacillus drentensis]|uniref:SDR family oxidoreductase n=1 Tax=Neobacillus drentensis TaxID=220684 RepID=UPI002FFE5E13